jgi:hypothetical protein
MFSFYTIFKNWDIIHMPYDSSIQNSIDCGLFTELCNYHHYLISEHFHYLQKETLYTSAVAPFPANPIPSRPWQPLIYFLSLWICICWTFHINESTTCDLLCLSSLTWYNFFFPPAVLGFELKASCLWVRCYST